MAAALLAERLADAGVPAHVHSAGLLDGGRPATAEGIKVMAARGIDTSSHRSRRLTAELVGEAELVICLAREHVQEVVAACPAAWPHTFTLKEIVRRAEEVGASAGGSDLAGWLARVHEGRRTSDLLGSSADDDVDDPIGRRLARYERTASELDDLTRRLGRLLTAGTRSAPEGVREA